MAGVSGGGEEGEGGKGEENKGNSTGPKYRACKKLKELAYTEKKKKNETRPGTGGPLKGGCIEVRGNKKVQVPPLVNQLCGKKVVRKREN